LSKVCISHGLFRHNPVRDQVLYRGMLVQDGMRPLTIVEDQILRQLLLEGNWVAHQAFVHLNRLFGHGSLIALDTPVELGTAGVAELLSDLPLFQILPKLAQNSGPLSFSTEAIAVRG
jgi:hypothetical protein